MSGTPAERDKETMETIKAELEAAPSLKGYDYQAWDEDTRTFVNDVLRMYLNPGDSIAQITSVPKAAPKAAPKAEPVAETISSNSESTAVKSEDDLDSFLNDLDI